MTYSYYLQLLQLLFYWSNLLWDTVWLTQKEKEYLIPLMGEAQLHVSEEIIYRFPLTQWMHVIALFTVYYS